MEKPKRNPERVIAALRACLARYPDLRVGQMIGNAAAGKRDPYYIEDDQLAKELESIAREGLDERPEG
jgi:hypothetical protein